MIEFTVPGLPIAKGRARAANRGGHIRMVTPEKTIRYESTVALFARQAMAGRAPLVGPVELSFTAVFPMAKDWTKKRLAAHAVCPELLTKKPDLSNILKALEDGMNSIVFADDCQIARLGNCVKVYGDVPGVTVRVRALSHETEREPETPKAIACEREAA